MKKFILPLIVLVPAISEYLFEEVLSLDGARRLALSAFIASIIYLLQELINKPYKFSFTRENFVNGVIEIPYKKHRKKLPSVNVYNENNQEVDVGVTITEKWTVKIAVEEQCIFEGYCIIK